MGKQASPSMGVRGPFKGCPHQPPGALDEPPRRASRRAGTACHRAGLAAASGPRAAGARQGATAPSAPEAGRARVAPGPRAAASGPRAAGARPGAAAPSAPEAGRARAAWSGRAAAPRVCKGVRAARGKPAPRLASSRAGRTSSCAAGPVEAGLGHSSEKTARR
jgi:translation initiation factor IF-2